MHFRFLPFFLLLLPFAMTEIQEGFVSAIVPELETSVMKECSSIIEGPGLNLPQTRMLLPLNTICHPNMEKYIDCMAKGVYKSKSIIDIQMRSVTDFKKYKAATKSFCQEAPKLIKGTRFCNASHHTCASDFRPSIGSINKDSPLFCRLRKNRRCEFNELAKCDLQTAMIWAKYEEEAQSIGCLISDPMIQLVPTYGPELKCYSSINISDIEPTDYRQIYERYCDQFNYDDVSACVEESLSKVTSEELLEDKESYINKAKKFVNDRHTLCKKMTALSNHKCVTPAFNVDNCKKMFFIPPGPAKFNASESVKYFGYCNWTAYLDCNLDFGNIIYNNLITYFV